MAFLPACAPAAVSLASCPDGSPGVSNIYYCQRSDISAVTVSSGVITGFTMATGQIFYEIQTDDQVSTFEEPGSEIRYASKHVQTLVTKIPGISAAIQKQLLSIKNCCDLVVVVKLNSGIYKVMGYDVDYANDTATAKNCQINLLNFTSLATQDDDYAGFDFGATCTTTGMAPIFEGTLTLS